MVGTFQSLIRLFPSEKKRNRKQPEKVPRKEDERIPILRNEIKDLNNMALIPYKIMRNNRVDHKIIGTREDSESLIKRISETLTGSL